MYKIKYKNILLTILLIGLVFSLSGCGGECKKSSDCPSKTCYIVKCIEEKCVETPQENCCGNLVCDTTETKCSCQRDCGPCTGTVGEYLEYYCDDDACVSDIKKRITEQKSFTDKISLRNVGDISATYVYDNPFNTDASLFNVRFVLDKKQNDIEYIKINKINVYEEISKRGEQVKTLGEKLIDQILWDIRTDVTDEIILPVNVSDQGEEKKVTVEIIYEYAKLSRGTTSISSGSYKKQITDKIIFLNPSKQKRCPSSCDDKNTCTTDLCSAATDFFCKHEIKTGSCCGNHKCDSNEDQCSCQQDCGYCEKNFGDYIEYACVSNKCSSRLKVSQKEKTLIDEANMNDIRVEMKTKFNEPFDIGTDTYDVELELKYAADNVKNIKCTELQVLSGNELLGEKTISASFTKVGDSYSTATESTFSMTEVEEDKNTNIKLECTYDKTVSDKTTSYTKTSTQDLDIITYVNPDV